MHIRHQLVSRSMNDRNDRDDGYLQTPQQRSCIEVFVKCICVFPCAILIALFQAFCSCLGLVSKKRPPEWNTSLSLAVAIMRAVTHNVVRNIGCIRFFSDQRVPTWLPTLPNETVRVVHQRAASFETDGCPVTGEWTYQKDIPDPRTTPPRRAILYIHGGAFALCTPTTHRGITMRLVEASNNRSNNGSELDGLAVFALDYRRPPEHPHPASIEDCILTYKWLLQYMGAGAEDRILLAGDSAGGALIVLMMTKMKKDNSTPLPAGGIMLSPWVDLEDTSHPSWEENEDLDYLPPDLCNFLARSVVGYSGPSLYDISATNQDLAGLPPLLIMVGEKEVLRDQIVEFSKKATAAGTNVECVVEPGMIHVFVAFADILPTQFATKWFGLMGVFINKINLPITIGSLRQDVKASVPPTGEHKMCINQNSSYMLLDDSSEGS